MSYHRPETLKDALDWLAGAGERARIAAGCTDLFPATERPSLPGPILDITAIPELREITRTAQGWRFGATATWTDLVRADLPPAFDGLKAAAREVGSIQIQNAGTLAGNLCNASPAADGVPGWLTLDAMVELAGAEGRRTLPLTAFLTGPRQTALAPGEIMTAITVPEASASGQGAFVKLGARSYLVISIAMAAVRLRVEAGQIAEAALSIGACSAVACRLPVAEARLLGQPVEAAVRLLADEVIAGDLSPISDVRGDAAYRLAAAPELLRRAVAKVIPLREVA
ncbi:MAG: FAD binding domain-containing protein [Pseudomonadota bacterium]